MKYKTIWTAIGAVFCMGLFWLFIAESPITNAAVAMEEVKQAKQHMNQQKEHKKMSETSNMIHLQLETGVVTLELYPEVAPATVKSFKKLVTDGFYDGLTFHRVIAGFMAQGGDPEGTGMGNAGFKLKAEFNATKHVRGTLAMARSGDPDSASSQFYICFAPQPHLDGQYTVFGQVTDGMELIDDVKQGTIMQKLTIVEAGE
ncbi:MAG: peptidylprolyl isomerase [Ghiorsea sp.]